MIEELERGIDFAHEAVHAAVVHARRVAGIVSTAVRGVAQALGDIAWDYRDMASTARQSTRH